MNKAVLFLAALAVAACQQQVPETARPIGVPVQSGAGPGAGIASPETAGEIFARACVETAPSYAGTSAALNPYGFRQNRETGTFYNVTLNLSVKVTQERCSLVFANNAPATQVEAGVARGAASVVAGGRLPRNITVVPSATSGGLRYYRVALDR